MSEEQMKVLDMLAEHKITAEQAERLLDALGRREAAPVAAVAEQAAAKLHEVFGRVFGGQAAASRTESAEETVGEAVEGAEAGFSMPPDSSLVVRVKGGNVRVRQQDEGQTASVTSSGPGAASVRRKGSQYFLTAGSSAGNVEAAIPPVRAVQVRLLGGNVRLEGVRADVKANLKGGTFDAQDCTGGFTVKCMGGSATIGGTVTAIDLRCMGGSMALRDLCIQEGEHRIRIMGGRVDLVVSPEASLTVRTRAFGGEVTCDVPAESEAGKGPKRQSEYKFGDGAAVLNVKMFGGALNISGAEPAGAGLADETREEE